MPSITTVIKISGSVKAELPDCRVGFINFRKWAKRFGFGLFLPLMPSVVIGFLGSILEGSSTRRRSAAKPQNKTGRDAFHSVPHVEYWIMGTLWKASLSENVRGNAR